MKNKVVFSLFILAAILIAISSCQSESEITYLRYYTSGKKLYEANCQNCHNQDGTGLAALYPPLTDSLFLKKNKDQLACYIKYGLKGKIEVAGKTFDAPMPAQAQLSDIEIAEIVTYITNSFGNKQGLRLATEVASDLKQCR